MELKNDALDQIEELKIKLSEYIKALRFVIENSPIAYNPKGEYYNVFIGRNGQHLTISKDDDLYDDTKFIHYRRNHE